MHSLSPFTSLLRNAFPDLPLFSLLAASGSTMRVHHLARTWPTALALFTARIVSIWLGVYATSTACATKHAAFTTTPRGGGSGSKGGGGGGGGSGGGLLGGCGAEGSLACCGWAAFVTQAGIALGLADEIANNFPSWGPGLQASLVSAIVLSQFVGPPLLKCALGLSGEADALSRRRVSRPGAHERDGARGLEEHEHGGGAARVDGAHDDVTRVTERPTAALLRADRARAAPAARGGGGGGGGVHDGGETSEDEASTVVVSFGLRGS